MTLKGCGKTIRIFLLGFSLIRGAICLSCCSCAVRLLLTDRNELFDAYTSHHKLLKASLLMMVIFGLSGIVSEIFLWMGATQEQRPLIILHLLVNILLFLLVLGPLITFGIMTAKTKTPSGPSDERLTRVSDSLIKYKSTLQKNPNDTASEQMDSIQKKLRCCGWDDLKDWTTSINSTLPTSCCRKSVEKNKKKKCENPPAESQVYDTPCKSALLRFIHDYSLYLVVIVALQEFFAILSGFGSVILLCKISVILRPGQKKGFFDKLLSPGGA